MDWASAALVGMTAPLDRLIAAMGMSSGVLGHCVGGLDGRGAEGINLTERLVF